MSTCTLPRFLAAALAIQTFVLVASPTLASLVIGAVDTPVTQNFNTLTTDTSLPTLDAGGWRTWITFEAPTFSGGAVSPTLKLQTTTLNGTNLGGIYSFRDGAATSDRSLGLILSNLSRHIMVEIKNDTTSTLDTLSASWNLEKYRNGHSTLGVSFFHSSDGVTWLSGGIGTASFAGSGNYNGTISPSLTPQTATISGLSIASGAFHYLRWEFAITEGTAAPPAVGLDDFSITGFSATAVPEASSCLAVAAFAGVVGLLHRRCRRSQSHA